MKKISLLLILCIFLLTVVGCSANNTPNYGITDEVISELELEESSSSVHFDNIALKNYVISKGSRVYFSGSGILLDITDDDNISIVYPNGTSEDIFTNYSFSKEAELIYLNASSSSYEGNSIYFYDYPNGICKATFKSDNSIDKEVLLDEDTLDNAFSGDAFKFIGDYVHDLCICNGYLCFCYIPDPGGYTEKSYGICKINIESKTIEFFDDIHASALTTKDGWLYYYDNGFSNTMVDGSGETDHDVIGIYRMKIDGSEKELLVKGFEERPSYPKTHAKYCINLTIFNDYLYFIDDSKDGQSRVCRIKLNGSEKEYITQNGAHRFTVDEQKNKLYYSYGLAQSDLAISRTVYDVSLDSGRETELFEVDGCREFTIYDDYLYISDFISGFYPITSREDKIPCGERYNIKNGTMEILYGYKDVALQVNPETGGYERVGEDEQPEYVWELVSLSDGPF